MKPSIAHASLPTQRPAAAWQGKTDAERLGLVSDAIDQLAPGAKPKVLAVAARSDGQVIVRFQEPMGPSQRGTVLLDLEESLKQTVEPGLTVWLEAMGDRNSLRRLRGIEVIS